jgi:hypothetical protein
MKKVQRKRYTKSECLDAVRQFHVETGQISSSAYVKWRSKGKFRPGLATIYNFTENWGNVVTELGLSKVEYFSTAKPIAGKQICKRAIRIFYEATGDLTYKSYQSWQKENQNFPTLVEIQATVDWKEYKKKLTKRGRINKKTAV